MDLSLSSLGLVYNDVPYQHDFHSMFFTMSKQTFTKPCRSMTESCRKMFLFDFFLPPLVALPFLIAFLSLTKESPGRQLELVTALQSCSSGIAAHNFSGPSKSKKGAKEEGEGQTFSSDPDGFVVFEQTFLLFVAVVRLIRLFVSTCGRPFQVGQNDSNIRRQLVGVGHLLNKLCTDF